MKSLRRATELAFLMLVGAPALGQTYVYHHQRIQDPFRPTESVAIDRGPNNSARYVAAIENLPIIQPPSLRPLMVWLDGKLNPIQMTTYIRPGEDQVPYNTQLILSPNELFSTSDGGSIVCGQFSETTAAGGVVLDGAFLLKLDVADNVMWHRIYPNLDSFNDVIEIQPVPGIPAQYVACGFRIPNPNTESTAIVVATDGLGAILWERDVWGVKNNFRGAATYKQVIETSVGRYALVGTANGRRQGAATLIDADVLHTRIDVGGAIFLNRIYGLTTIGVGGINYGVVEQGDSLQQINPNGEMLLAGEIAANPPVGVPPGAAFEDVLALRVDPAGNPVWVRRYDVDGNYDAARDLKMVGNARAVISADCETTFFGAPANMDVGSLHIDIAGNPIGLSEVFGGRQDDWAAQALLPWGIPFNNSILHLATTLNFGPNHMVPYLIERFPTVCRDCQSKRVQLRVNALQPPVMQPFFEIFQTQGTFRELVEVPWDWNQHNVCRRCLVGDMNGDGVVSVGDIAGFVLALTNPAAYPATYPDGCLESADINCDGVVSVGDIGPFVALISGP